MAGYGLDSEDTRLIIALAGCSLDASPKSNWVQSSGGLPEYICRIARAVKRSGKSTSAAIAIAVSRAKRWAAGLDDVSAKTRAKAAMAVAQWEKLKAKAKGKKVVKATREDGSEFIMLAATTDFNTEMVRNAWQAKVAEARSEYYADNKGASEVYDYPYSYVRELWTTYLIVEIQKNGEMLLEKVPYSVDDSGDVEFGDPQPVKVQYVPDDSQDIEWDDEDYDFLVDLSAHEV